MDRPQDTLRLLSVCTGYGGVELGLQRVFGDRLVCIAGCEIEAFAAHNLVAKIEAGLFNSTFPVWTDLRSFPFGSFHGLVDIFAAGFPCSPFSCAGRRAADADERHLFPAIKEGIVATRPNWVFLENVSGIVSAKLKGDQWIDPQGTPVLLHVLRELERVDYRCTCGLFSAAEVGAPHRRTRVFILGYDCEGGRQPRPLHGAEQQPTDPAEDAVASGHATQVVWPTGPHEPQHRWEPPRTICDATKSYGPVAEGDDDVGHSTMVRRERPTTICGGTHTGTRKGGLQEPPRRSAVDDAGVRRPPRMRSQEIEPRGNSSLASGAVHNGAGEVAPLGETESALGGNSDGVADRVGHAELYQSCDDRRDELMLLGNGVVPQTAERAWRTLYARLIADQETSAVPSTVSFRSLFEDE